ncbi:MAG: pilus assembly PilX N-terminal domain-containing protein [Acetobacteraceae bacterium]|nr:pilus assembly PilX N-terminal domain-containing protein [Acetobacteraceae bacterium]
MQGLGPRIKSGRGPGGEGAEAARGGRGAAFLLVFFTMALISLLGIALLTLATSELRGAQFRKQHAQAFNVAEGGLDKACTILADDPGWREGLDEPLGAGRYEVSVESLGGGVVLVTSVGRWGSAVETVQARVKVGWGAFSHALYTSSSLELKKDANIVGDVQINGDLVGDADVYIDGRLALTGQVELTGDLEATEGVEEGAPAVEEPVPDLEWYRANCTQHLFGNQSFTGGSYGDEIILVEGGQCLVSGEYSGHVTIVATGRVHVPRELTVTGPGSWVVLVGLEGVEVDGAKVVQALLWSPESVKVRGGAVSVAGGIVGGDVEITCRLTLEGDPRFAENPPPGAPGGRMEILEWRGHPGD